ncbi:inactive ubiquitin thioesterase OTULINL [Hyperolius riggenbachi]|uniref:inactive ubiquitin thioesterase OTULINL n=1 Tax=Hyperolius riggenbachi TaxID=752182 RepID=UPI0035A2B47B
MDHRRNEEGPGSPDYSRGVQRDCRLHSSITTAGASEASRVSLLHVVTGKLWYLGQQCLLFAVAILVLMWRGFRDVVCWSLMPYQGLFSEKRNLSVNAEVDVRSYSRKWKGEAENVTQIRKAYEELYSKHHIKTLLVVKQDNYCLLRAVMFQVFSQGIPFPGWMKEKDILSLPEKLYSQGCNWIQQFSFGPEKYTGGNAFGKLRGCVEVFKNQWTEFSSCKDRLERTRMCKSAFSDEVLENKLYEALKFIMLYLMIEAYENMKSGQEIPSLFHFLFSREHSAYPLSYMVNHLNLVGDTASLEQAELCLVGYALEIKIKIFQLTKMDTEDFEICYPECYKSEWPEISLVTDDDQHYNIPVATI